MEINASWLAVFLLLTLVIAQELGETNLGWPTAQRWLVSALLVVLFFISVLAHELSHSLLARRIGIPVHSITLFIFGGVSRLGRQPGRPLTEFSVAVVGPAASLLLSAVFGGAWYLLGAPNSVLGVVLFVLAWTNLVLGGFNMLPGYPLDGGRVLRSAIWGVTGSYRRGTAVAIRAGQAIGGATVVLGIVAAVLRSPLDGAWIAVVGVFLFSVATVSFRREIGQPSGGA